MPVSIPLRMLNLSPTCFLTCRASFRWHSELLYMDLLDSCIPPTPHTLDSSGPTPTSLQDPKTRWRKERLCRQFEEVEGFREGQQVIRG
jgi:hypothetical protein